MVEIYHTGIVQVVDKDDSSCFLSVSPFMRCIKLGFESKESFFS
jgi:hypothetical protein